MNDSIEQARSDVHQAFNRAFRLADEPAKRSMWEFEREAWTLMLAAGRALVALFLIRRTQRPRAPEYRWGGVKYVLREWRTTPLGTRFGKVPFSRPVGRRQWAQRKKADLPVDRELGLCGGFSLGVVLGMARLCAQMAFINARETHRDVYEWAPSSRATLRIVDAVGDQAGAFLKSAPAPKDDGEILVLQVDGGGAPMIASAEIARRKKRHRKRSGARGRGTVRSRRRLKRKGNPRPRRTTGKKSKNAKIGFVAVIYTLKTTPEGIEGPINKRLIGTFESHRALFELLLAEATKRGYGRKRTLFLADGSEHIWRLQKELLPEAEPCLDWYHLAEYLWSASRSLRLDGQPAIRRWVDEQKNRLRAGRIDEVIAELKARLDVVPKTGPGNKGRRQRLSTTLGYITTHRERLPYQAFIAADLDIGSGAIEGAIRNLIRMRLDGPGMRWGRQRSERVLQLRCVLLNGMWSDFAGHLTKLEGFSLAAQPEPAQTHDAKAA